jgi:hypothetical protein
MSEKTGRGLKILEAAVLLGVLGDALLRAHPWGLNVLLWAGAFAIALLVSLTRWRRRALAGGGHWLLLAALLCASAYAWRDSLTLNFLAGAGALTSLALLAWRARGGPIRFAGLTDYAWGILVAAGNALCTGFPGLVGDVNWKEVTGAGWSRYWKPIARGLLIAFPLLLLFCGLFVAADAGFADLLGGFFTTNHDAALGHILLALCLTWVSGGFLRGVLFGGEVKPRAHATIMAQTQTAGNAAAAADPYAALMPPPAKSEPISLGIIEVGVTLGLLDLLFLAFVLTQLRYLFGGAALVQGEGEWTYAQYYRRGFFELVTVAVLVLPVLLSAHKLLRKENPAHERVFRALAGAHIILLFVVMASAVRRMLLYQSEYGLTELRLYTTAFIAWLGLVFVWFILTVLRGRREQFAFGMIIAGFLVIAALHFINPDALIVRTNVAHARAGRGFDAAYALSLSADAVPALIESLPELKDQRDQRYLAVELLEQWSGDEDADWRTWNWSRSQVRPAVRDNWGALNALDTEWRINHEAAPPDEIMPPSVSSSGEVAPAVKSSAAGAKVLTQRRKGAKGRERIAHRR